MTSISSSSPDLPREASIDRLLTVLSLVESTPQKKTELIDELGVNSDAGYDTFRLGISLNYLRETDQGITTTALGERLLEANEDTEIFFQGLQQHGDYCTILATLRDKELLHQGPLERDTVIRVLRKDLGVEMSANTLSERLNTMFRTFEAAGLGEYISGTNKTIAHFNFNSDFETQLESLLDDNTGSEQTELSSIQTATDSPETETSDPPGPTITDHNGSKSYTLQITLEIQPETSAGEIEDAVIAARKALEKDLSE